ncbi:MAG: hypothetical protein PHN89_05720, partial [Candidatus Pacebacteria bacterium]|nr:hypothetical protein [Candidatus Paceibacterota bacterium]
SSYAQSSFTIVLPTPTPAPVPVLQVSSGVQPAPLLTLGSVSNYPVLNVNLTAVGGNLAVNSLSMDATATSTGTSTNPSNIISLVGAYNASSTLGTTTSSTGSTTVMRTFTVNLRPPLAIQRGTTQTVTFKINTTTTPGKLYFSFAGATVTLPGILAPYSSIVNGPFGFNLSKLAFRAPDLGNLAELSGGIHKNVNVVEQFASVLESFGHFLGF